jgi:hypothetical protein
MLALGSLSESALGMRLQTNLHRATAENGVLIVLARIVDSTGKAVRAVDLLRIEYSIYEVDPCWPNFRTVVAGHQAVELDIGEIMLDSMQVGQLWTVDETGYNFRHEIFASGHCDFPKAGMEYEIRYRFASTVGETTVMRFRIKGSRNSRC